MAQAGSAAPGCRLSRGMHVVLDDDLWPAGLGLLVARHRRRSGCCFMLPFFGARWWAPTTPPCPLPSRAARANTKSYLLDYVQRWFPQILPPRWKQPAGARGRRCCADAAERPPARRGLVREHAVERSAAGLISGMAASGHLPQHGHRRSLPWWPSSSAVPLGMPVAGAIPGCRQRPRPRAPPSWRPWPQSSSNELTPLAAPPDRQAICLEAPAVLACAAACQRAHPPSADVIPLTAARWRQWPRLSGPATGGCAAPLPAGLVDQWRATGSEAGGRSAPAGSRRGLLAHQPPEEPIRRAGRRTTPGSPGKLHNPRSVRALRMAPALAEVEPGGGRPRYRRALRGPITVIAEQGFLALAALLAGTGVAEHVRGRSGSITPCRRSAGPVATGDW